MTRLSAIAAAVAVSLFTTGALAEDTPSPAGDKDGARFRGGVALEGGALIVPGTATMGIAGVNGQLGVQINNLVGLYAVPNFDVVFGEVGGVNLAAALMVDFTFLDDLLTVGAGLDAGVFAAIGVSETSSAAAGGALYGGRLHFGINPLVGRGDDGIRRKALTIGVDVRLLGGAAGSGSVSTTTAEASATTFVLSPSLSVGYTAF